MKHNQHNSSVDINYENTCREAYAHMQAGQHKEAEAAFTKAFALRRGDTGLLYNYAVSLHNFTGPEDPYLKMLLDASEQLPSLEKEQQAQVLYALFKAYDEIGAYETAFEYASRAAAIKRSATDYDPSVQKEYFAAIAGYFTPETISRHEDHGSSSEIPVFIAGFPRSGTTLIEQILHAHPDAAGIGENPAFGKIIRDHAKPLPAQGAYIWPYAVPGAENEGLSLRESAIKYLNHIDSLAPGKKRIVNKAITNYIWIGAIHLCFPKAKIIHVVRNPIDCCLSAFTTNFQPGIQPYSYDLNELGAYFAGYMQLMRHWKSILPGRTILTVRYEDIIADLEGQARRILECLDLPWSKNCLRFYETSRAIKTASALQVRKPLYSSSIGRWRHYERNLLPLITALGDYAREI